MAQHGQVIDVLVSTRRAAAAAREFLTQALRFGTPPVEVTTGRAPVSPRVLDEFVPTARHGTEQYMNNWVEADHGPGSQTVAAHRGCRFPASRRGCKIT